MGDGFAVPPRLKSPQASPSFPDSTREPDRYAQAIRAPIFVSISFGSTVIRQRTAEQRSRIGRRILLLTVASLCLLATRPVAAHVATGTYTGDATNNRPITGLGFQPDLVLIKADEDHPAMIRTSTMPVGMSKPLAWTEALGSARIQSLNPDGFTVRDDDFVNRDGRRFDWLALAADPGRLVVGSYVGDGVNGRAVAIGLQPDFVLVIPASAQQGVFRTSAMTGDVSFPFDDEAPLSNLIESLTATGFTVGDSFGINQSGTTYHYVAWRAVPGYAAVGRFWGNQDDNRDITGLGVRPAWAMVKAPTNKRGVHLTRSLIATAESMYFEQNKNAGNRLQTLLDDGFQVGADKEANEDGEWMYWAVVGAAVDLDVAVSSDVSSAYVGEQVVITTTVTDLGPDRAEAFEILSLLPAGLGYVSHAASSGSYDSGTGRWTIANLDAGGSAALTLTAEVLNGSAGQTLIHAASVVSSVEYDPDPANNASSTSIVVPRRADLLVLGSVDVATPVVGQTLSLTVVARSQGPDAATNVTTDALLPTGLEYVSHVQSTGTYDPAGGEWAINTLGAGTFGILEITAKVGAGTTGQTLMLPLAIASDIDDPVPANDTGSIAVRVIGADLEIALSADPPTLAPNDFVTLTVDLANAGPDPVNAADVVDLLPTGLVYVAAAPSQGSYDHATGHWNTGILMDGASASLVITARVANDASGTLQNTATILTAALPDPDETDNTATVTLTIHGADVALALAVDEGRPNVGDQIQFTLNVENVGFAGATNLLVGDLLPAGLAFVSAAPSQGLYDAVSGDWTIGSLSAGASCVLLLGARVLPGTGGSLLLNTASILGLDQPDMDAANDTAERPVTVQAADLQVIKSVDDPAPVQGAQAVFTIQVANQGPDAATNVAVADTLPPGLVFQGSTADQGSYDPATGLWSVGSLGVGQTVQLELDVNVQLDVSGGDSAVNTALVAAADQEDPEDSDNSDSAALTQQSADLNLAVVLDEPNPVAGDVVRFTLTVRNDGPSDVLSLTVRDTLPAGLVYAGHEPGGALYDPLSGDWTVGALPAGASTALELDAVVAATAVGRTLVNVARIAVSDQADPDGTDNRATVTLRVLAADLALSWVLDDPDPTVGDPVRATLTLDNAGPDPLQTAVIQVGLPDGLTLTGAAPGAGDWNGALSEWAPGPLPTGSATTLVLDFLVADGNVGTTPNFTALVADARPSDPTPAAAPATAFVTVRGADLSLDISANVGSAGEGESVYYTLTIRNEGPDPVGGVQVRDLLPASLVYLGHTPGAAAYDPLSGNWDIGSLQTGESAALFLQTRLSGTTPGDVVTNAAAVTGADLADPDPTDDAAQVGVVVPAADLATALSLDDATPAMDDLVVVTLDLANDGPDDASGVVVDLALPTGLIFQYSDSPSYDPAAGRWFVGDLDAGDLEALHVTTRVAGGTAGQILVVGADLAESDQGDPESANDMSNVSATVQADADLAVRTFVDRAYADVGDTLVWTRRVRNDGPSATDGVALVDSLPDALTLLAWEADDGLYDPLTQLWTVGALAAGDSTELRLETRVGAGSGGSALRTAVAVSTSDVDDRNPGNDHAAATIHVYGADLALETYVDVDAPAEGGEVLLTFAVTNLGPDSANRVTLIDTLPPGLAYVSHTPPTEDFVSGNDGLGVWNVGQIEGSSPRVLFVRTRVAPGTTGTVLRHGAEVVVEGREDPDPLNNRAANLLAVEGTDLELRVSPASSAAEEGALVTATLTVTNHGPRAATGVVVRDMLASGLEFVSAEPVGAYDAVTGLWTVGALEPDAETALSLTLRIGALTGGSALEHHAGITALDQVDPTPGNDAAQGVYTIPVPGTGRIDVLVLPLADDALRPLAAPAPVLRFRLVNRTLRDETLTALTVRDSLRSDGTPEQRDASWSDLELWERNGGDWRRVAFLDDGFTSGTALFDGLDRTLAGADSLDLELRGAVSAAARDGDGLVVSLDDAGALAFAEAVTVDGAWPLVTVAERRVDGFVAAQAAIAPVAAGVLAPGETGRPVLRVVLPADGWAPATLRSLRLLNQGTARPGTEIAALHAWIDDGDGALTPGPDQPLGDPVWTGDGWLLSGLDRTIPVEGLRVLVTVDAAPTAEGQRSVRFAVPVGGVEVDDGNDGPLDVALVNDYAQVVSGVDRLYLGAASRSWRTTPADGKEHLILHLTATNTFDTPRTITSLRFTNASVSPWTDDPDLLDAALGQVVLRDDAGDDGLPGPGDAVLGAASLNGGEAVLGGLTWTVPPATTRHLFVNVRPSPEHAADGDNLALILGSAVDVQLDLASELYGQWPLDGGGGLVIDATVAARFAVTPHGSAMAAPGTADVLLLDVVAPGNGHAADLLERFSVVNDGDATPSDLAALRLWRDGEVPGFDPLDDADLGELVHRNGVWTLDGLSEAIPVAGRRYFVSGDLSDAARDSATVSLSIPLDGAGYASGADGPLDVSVASGTTVLVGAGSLLSALTVQSAEVVVGQEVTVRMTVTNGGLAPVTDILPLPLVLTGTGALTPVSGPEPGATDLAPGARIEFVWILTAASVGQVVPVAVAAGSLGTLPVETLPIAAAPVRIATAPPELGLSTLSQLPFAVNGGQTDVSALTLTLTHRGDATTADVRLDSLTFRLEDGAGAPVAAGGVLQRVVVRADGLLLYSAPVAADAGPVLTLVPATPPRLGSGDEFVLTLSVELTPTAAGAEFRFVVDADGIAAHDAVAGATVGIDLGVGSFPVRSELTRVVDGAPALGIVDGDHATTEASLGQTGVTLSRLVLTNPGVPELGAGIQLGVLPLQLVDGDGQPVAEPAACIVALELRRGEDLLARLETVPAGGGELVVPLDTPLAIEAGVPVVLDVRVDLHPEAPVGRLAAHFAGDASWDARDANSGVPVGVVLAPDPILTTGVVLVRPADLAHLGGRALGPATLTGGAREQSVLEVTVRHPGLPETAPVAVDSLVLVCRNESGDPLTPASVLERITARVDGTVVGLVPATLRADGRLPIPLTGALCAPGARLVVDLAVDVRTDLLAERFSLSLDLPDVRVSDAHLGRDALVTADAGAVVPLSTGLREVRLAADELVVSVSDRMPAVVAALGEPVPALELSLTNTATFAAGELLLTELSFAARDAAGDAAFGSLAGVFTARVGGELWGTSPEPTRGDSLLVIAGEAGLRIPPGVSVAIELRFEPMAAPAGSSLSVGFGLDGLSVRQPEGELVTVRVLPAPGQVFPFWTESGTLSAASLEESYSNFPNPFAAGREATTFVFALTGPSTVDLRLYTPRGEPVRTVLSAETRGAGLHQDVTWDGRNGNGDPVRNGVYIAEIIVREENGATTTLRRKVAVVR